MNEFDIAIGALFEKIGKKEILEKIKQKGNIANYTLKYQFEVLAKLKRNNIINDYEHSDFRIEELISRTKFNCKYLLLYGTIHINGDFDMGSFNESRKFDLINLKNGERKKYIDSKE